MGWCSYLINDTKKVYVRIGKAIEEDFVEDARMASLALAQLDEANISLGEIEEKELGELKVEEVMELAHIVRNFKDFCMATENYNMSALFLYQSWKSEDDKLKIMVDESPEGYIEL